MINYTGQQQIFCLRFLADLGRIRCAESKSYIGFAQSGQVFELWPHVFLHFCSHVRMCGAFKKLVGVK